MCQSLFINSVADLRPATLLKKETLALTQVFSCEFSKIFKNTFSYRTPLVTGSVLLRSILRTPISLQLNMAWPELSLK